MSLPINKIESSHTTSQLGHHQSASWSENHESATELVPQEEPHKASYMLSAVLVTVIACSRF